MKPWRAVWLGGAMLATSCAAAGPESPAATGVSPADVYARRVSTPYVNVYWTCTVGRDAVRVDGAVQNNKGGRVLFAEVELAAAGGRWGHDAAVSTALPDTVLYTYQHSPFRLELRKAGDERFDLFYTYTIDPPPGEDTRQRYLARDVCRP